MSPAATVAKGSGSNPVPAPPAATVPFLAGSWEYSEPMFTDTLAGGATAAAPTEFVHQITPGGFLRGVSFFLTSASGVIGTGVISGDAPFIIISQMSIESIDGTPILYPMSGYSAYLVTKFCRSWDGDPAQDGAVYSAGINPSFRFRFFNESRMTIGVLPNVDARAQYRVRYTLNQAGYFTSGTVTTFPTITVQGNLETWAQPPTMDYQGNAVVQNPDGLALQRFVSHQIDNTSGGDQTYKNNRVGNLRRTDILVFRGSTGVRADLTGDPIRIRQDNTQRLNENRTRRDYEVTRYWQQYFGDTGALLVRPTGVYVYPYWHNPGDMDGQYWVPTQEATYWQWELTATASGTMETITEDLAPAATVPAYLEGI